MALQLISPSTQLDAIGSFRQGASIADAISQRNQEQQQLQIRQDQIAFDKAQILKQQQQQEALQKIAVEAFNNPEALKQVYARDPKLGQSIAGERDKYNKITSAVISDAVSAPAGSKQAVWDRARGILEQRGFATDDLPAKYSPEVESMLRMKQKELKTWDSALQTLNTSQGIALIDDSGNITPTGYKPYEKPDSAFSGGATGAVVKQIMKDNPGMNFTQALQLYQTGFRQGTRITPEGNVEVIPGAAEAKTTIKSAESEGTAFGTETGTQKALLRSMNSKMPELESTVNNLSKLGKLATYTTTGKVVNETRKQLGLPPSEGAVTREEYINTVRDQVLPLLRQTFGSQFTAREGDSLVATLGDLDKTPQEKDAALRSFIRQKRQTIQSLEREVGTPKQSKQQDFSEEDIKHTAQKYGTTPEEVRRRLGK